MKNVFASTWVVLGLTALVVIGMFVLAALGRMDAQTAVTSAISFVMGILTAWNRGVSPSPTEGNQP